MDDRRGKVRRRVEESAEVCMWIFAERVLGRVCGDRLEERLYHRCERHWRWVRNDKGLNHSSKGRRVNALEKGFSEGGLVDDSQIQAMINSVGCGPWVYRRNRCIILQRCILDRGNNRLGRGDWVRRIKTGFRIGING